MTQELLPCPFCNGSPEYDPDGTQWHLGCTECDFFMSTQICDHMTIEERQQSTFSFEGSQRGYEEKFIARAEKNLAERWNCRAGGWQLIDTAPKDGSLILVYSKEINAYDVVYWDGDYWQIFDSGACIETPGKWLPIGKPPSEKKK